MIELEDVAKGAVPQGVTLARRQIVDTAAFQMNLAGVWFVQGGKDVEQLALDVVAGADDADACTAGDGKIDALQHRDVDAVLVIGLLQSAGDEQFSGHRVIPWYLLIQIAEPARGAEAPPARRGRRWHPWRWQSRRCSPTG